MYEHEVPVAEAAAAATLQTIAGRLTALSVLPVNAIQLAAMRQAGPALAGALTSLHLDYSIDDAQRDMQAVAAAVQGIAAGLQHVDIELSSGPCFMNPCQAADAAFLELMRSLPCCQHLAR